MLSSRNEWIVVGILIAYLAFVPSLQMVRDILSTSVGKAAALAAIIYVHKYISCPVALLLVIAYVRCARSSGLEMFTTPTGTVPPTMTCSEGYALDSMATPPVCRPTSSMSGSIPPSPPESGVGASVSTPPPNTTISTAPMTTPTATMPPIVPMNTSGGVQPSTGSSSSVAPV